ncbi:MAG: hypothetical protein AYK23_00330 [Candidatus Proteinoplasmatales archaeon SG8-5]|nr:MAG: hypothetical protein AYK23_00330 [Candidatus Proteinoplasmatales archaeon SG8-5]
MNDKVRPLLLFSIVIVLVLIPKFTFAANDIHDSFSYSNSALAQTAINEENIEFYPYENEVNTINRHANGWSIRWVVTSMISSISLVTGLSPRDLQSLPICTFGILILAYLVAMKLTKDWRLSTFYMVIIAFDPTVNSLTNSTYIQGWGFLFFYMLIYLAMIIVERKYYLALFKEREDYRPFALFGSLAVCSLVMMYFSYYSALIYAVILLVVVAGGKMFMGPTRQIDRRHITIFIAALAAIFVVLYFVEETVRFAISNFQDFLETSYDYVITAISTAGPRFYVGLASYILMGIPLVFLGYKWLRAMRRNKAFPTLNWKDLFIIGFIITGILNLAIYTGLGLVDLKYIIMFFSLAALYSIVRLKPSDIKNFNLSKLRSIPKKQAFAAVLAFLFLFKFITYIGPIIDDNTTQDSIGLDWISYIGLDADSASISDLRLSGEIMLYHTEQGHEEFNSYVYSAYYLTNLENMNATNYYELNEEMDYIILTGANEEGTFNVGNWDSWSTDADVMAMLGNYTFIHKVYISNDISVWRVMVNL